MGKYVYVRTQENEKGKYYQVKDFAFETISNMPFYKQKYIYFQLWEGEERHIFDDKEIYDIFPGEVLKIVYYGKKLTYEQVKNIILNDPKYQSLLDSMNIDLRNSFYNSISQEEIESMLEDNIEEEFIYDALFSEGRKQLFAKKYDQEHYCILIPPETFIPCRKPYILSIEEYDKRIKLDYTEKISLMALNSQIGFKYIEDKKAALECFDIFFESIIRIRNYVNPEGIFNTISFDFRSFNNLNTLEDINFFLNYYKYAKQLDGEILKILDSYIEFINQSYDRDINRQ